MELARRTLEDFIAGKSEFDAQGTLIKLAGEEHWHPDIELEVPEAVVPEMRGVFRGKDAVRRWWAEWLGAWETVEFEYELLDAGDRIVVLIDQRMRGRATGIEVSRGNYAQVGTYREGLLVHWRFYDDQSAALRATGLRGSPARCADKT